MRVGIVAYEMEDERTGVGRYLAGLLRGLRAAAPERWRFSLFFHRRAPELELLGHPAYRAVLPPSATPASRVLFEQLALPALVRASGVDLLFSPGYSLPPRTGVPGMVTLHDLSFERLGSEFGWRERWRRRILARRAARVARRVLVDTTPMRDEVCARYRIPAARVGVVPLAVESRFSTREQPADREALERLGVRPPYLLFVGALFERRSPELMVGALATLARTRPELELVIAGPDRLRDAGRFERLCRERSVAERIRRLGWVGDDVLPPLYRRAAATLYLSRYEGFGLPPLESLACGTPAVVAAGLGLDELWPEYPFRAKSFERAHVVEACEAALACDRAAFAAAAAERLARSSWEGTAALWLAEAERAVA